MYRVANTYICEQHFGDASYQKRHKTKLKNFNLQRLLLATTNLNPDIKRLDAKKLPNSRFKEL
jgi:hypothetical protein